MGYKRDYSNKNWIVYEKDKERIYEMEFKYNTSWDWLMPVIEKIETLETNEGYIDFDIYSNAVIVETPETKIALYNLSEETFTTKLESTYKAVIDAINWIKQNAAKKV